MPKSDEQIASGLKILYETCDDWEDQDWNRRVLAALAAARAEQHAECVRLLRECDTSEGPYQWEAGWHDAAEWLEQHKP